MQRLLPELKNSNLKRLLTILGVLVLVGAAVLTPVAAEEGEADTAHEISLLEFIQFGGTIGIVIIFLSFVAVGFTIEHFLTIRHKNLIPLDFIDQVEGLLDTKQYDDAQELSVQNRSFTAAIIAAGLAERGRGMLSYIDMQNAMQEAGEAQTGRFYRKIEVLSVISRVSPMLGLLGTVIGMISAFNVIAHTEGMASPRQLAGGISTALVTTCMGLIVAIPTLCVVSFFRHKLDAVVSEAEATVEHLMGRFKNG